MKKIIRPLMLILLTVTLWGCSESSSFSEDFKNEAGDEGISFSSRLTFSFNAEEVKLTGMLDSNTPNTEPEDMEEPILPLESEETYAYDISRQGEQLTISIDTGEEVVDYTLEIAGPRILMDNENGLTYESTYVFEE